MKVAQRGFYFGLDIGAEQVEKQNKLRAIPVVENISKYQIF